MKIKENNNQEAEIIVMFMQQQLTKIQDAKTTGVFNSQIYSLRNGILKYGNKGKQAIIKQLTQLHHRRVFKPIYLSGLTQIERDKAMNSLIFLTEKRDGTIKARACANGSTQRPCIDKHDATSPTVTTETLMITAVIDAKQNRDVITLDDTLNAFVQTPVSKSEEKVIMRITGLLVDYLVNLFPTKYEDYVTIQNQTKLLYVEMEKALYGMMLSSLLFYKHFQQDLESIGFKVNPYVICVANQIVGGHQQTVTWHVDDVKVSHISKQVNEELCENKYGSDLNGHIKVTRGKKHEYLVMLLDHSDKGKLKIGINPGYSRDISGKRIW